MNIFIFYSIIYPFKHMHNSASILLNITCIESNMSLTFKCTILCTTNKENLTLLLFTISDRFHHNYNHVKMLKNV